MILRLARRPFQDDHTRLSMLLWFHNIHQFMDRLNEIASQVDQDMRGGLAFGGNNEFMVGYTPPADIALENEGKHIHFSLRPDGRIEASGTRSFWANYFFAIEKTKYQYSLQGDRTRYRDTKNKTKPLFIGLQYDDTAYNVGYYDHTTDYEAARLQQLLEIAQANLVPIQAALDALVEAGAAQNLINQQTLLVTAAQLLVTTNSFR